MVMLYFGKHVEQLLKSSDKFCEQGGYTTTKQDSYVTITLKKAYANTNYSVDTQGIYTSYNNGNNNSGMIGTKTTTTFLLYEYDYACPQFWRAVGYIA